MHNVRLHTVSFKCIMYFGHIHTPIHSDCHSVQCDIPKSGLNAEAELRLMSFSSAFVTNKSDKTKHH